MPLRKTVKDGAIYESVKRNFHYEAFAWIKNEVVSKIKNMFAFLQLSIVNHVGSLHPEVVYSFFHASGLIKNYSKEVSV